MDGVIAEEQYLPGAQLLAAGDDDLTVLAPVVRVVLLPAVDAYRGPHPVVMREQGDVWRPYGVQHGQRRRAVPDVEPSRDGLLEIVRPRWTHRQRLLEHFLHGAPGLGVLRSREATCDQLVSIEHRSSGLPSGLTGNRTAGKVRSRCATGRRDGVRTRVRLEMPVPAHSRALSGTAGLDHELVDH